MTSSWCVQQDWYARCACLNNLFVMSAQPLVSLLDTAISQDTPSLTGSVHSRSDDGMLSEAPASQRRHVDMRARHWFLTWNNPPEDGKDILLSLRADKYVFQLERASTGTLHWQGVFSFVHAKKWSHLNNRLRPRGVWTVCRNVAAARQYCSKVDSRVNDKTFTKGYRVLRSVVDPLKGKELYAYQKLVLDMVSDEPDDRKIYWYWSWKGNIGKSSLCKHLCMKHNGILVGGKHKDAYFAIAELLKAEKPVDLVIFDLPRSMKSMVSFTAIEGIKNGCFFNSKYESRMCLFNPPHILLFANSAPDLSMLSDDRWVVKNLDNEVDC